MAKLSRLMIASELPDDDGCIPAGEYAAQVYESEIATPQSGRGEILVLKCQVIDGRHKGRLFWDRINTSNPSEKAEEIAHRHLRRLMDAIGLDAFDDTDELHGKPFMVTLIVKQDEKKDENGNVTRTYAPKNEVKTYKPFRNVKPTVQPSQVSTKATAAPKHTGTTPPPKQQATQQAAQADTSDPWS